MTVQRQTIGRRKATYELEIALVLIGLITGIYLFASATLDTAPSALFGHGIGIVGFTLMLATETLYSLRKRLRGMSWGRMSTWLQWHIVMGLVGPYMVFLHSAWQFRGLAGISLLLTGVVVLSGIVGRYLYTAIPRAADGRELDPAALQQRLQLLDDALRIPAADLLTRLPAPARAPSIVVTWLLNGWYRSRDRRAVARLFKELPQLNDGDRRELTLLAVERLQLQRQQLLSGQARRLLAVWHTLHVPLGIALFVTAVIHSAAAVYYATLLR